VIPLVERKKLDPSFGHRGIKPFVLQSFQFSRKITRVFVNEMGKLSHVIILIGVSKGIGQ
jgi:hypothetical protein